MRNNREAMKEIRQAIAEIAITNDTSLGPVEIYSPRSLRQRMADEKTKIEEQNRERMARLRDMRNSLVRS